MISEDPKPDDLIDPDPWTIVGLVVSATAMFAQLASLAMQATERTAVQAISARRSPIPGHLRNSVEEAILQVQRLIRLFPSVKSEPPKPEEQRFEFGATRLFLDSVSSSAYAEILGGLTLSTASIGRWAISLIQQKPALAAQIGADIIEILGPVHDRINRLYRSELTNEQVVDECMLMLRTFIQILDKLDRPEN